MYKLLIVDDEDFVRNAIVNILDWKELGFSEVYQAENGLQALEVALQCKPDLVLTDIKMPFMDGLELSAQLKEALPDTRIVVLSGHSEFKFAQEAIALGVLDYIIKPLGAATLTKKMTEIRKKLDHEFQERRYLEKIRSQLHQSLPVLRERFLYLQVCTAEGNSGAAENARARLDFLEIPLRDGPFVPCVIEPDLSAVKAEEPEIYSLGIKNLVMEIVGPRHPVFFDGADRVVVVFNTPLDPDDARLPDGTPPLQGSLLQQGSMSSQDKPAFQGNRDLITEILLILQKAAQLFLKTQVTAALGATAPGIGDLYASYNKALLALECKYTLGKGKIYDIHDLDYLEPAFFYPFDACAAFVNAVKIGGAATIEQVAARICDALKSRKNLSAANIKLIFVDIITNLLKMLTEAKDSTPETWSQGLMLYSVMDKLGTVEEIAAAVLPFAVKVSKALAASRTNSSMNIIAKVMDYVRQNYQLEDLSLHTVAVHVAVSPGYLSALFKKETGKNFTDFVTQLRMEKAMELLKVTDLKTYEVAYRTGFANPHYFSISFKKQTGKSPSEFRGVVEE